MNVPEAAIKVLQDNPNGLSAKMITDEIIKRELHPLPAKVPVGIVQRALNRHCIGFEKSYSCQDRYFTVSTDATGTQIYKLGENRPNSSSLIQNFVYPRHQVNILNGGADTRTGTKTRIMDAENQSIRNLLTRYCFRVPDYQRSYSWKNENIDEFLDDLFNVVHSSQADARHFLGALTMARRDDQSNAVDLIDGQQRVTTIFLFLYVLLSEFRSERFSEKAKGRPNKLLRMLVYLDDDDEPTGSRLELGEFNKAFFQEFVIDGYAKSDDERTCIKDTYKAKHEFAQNQAIYDAFNKMKLMVEERLDCCQNEEDAYEYLKALHMCILDRFEVVSMIVEEEADAFLIFETLNDRGLALSAVDLIKNKLFQTFASHPSEFDQLKSAWEKMCDNIENKDDLKKFILHYWRAYKGYTSAQSLYKTCRDYIASNGYEEAKSIVYDLKQLSVYYNGFCDPMSKYPWKSNELKTVLEDMKKMRYDLTHPILLAAIKKYPHDEASWAKVAKLCLNFMIRYISILKKKPTGIEKDICQWAYSPDPNVDFIDFLCGKFSQEAPDAVFKEELLTMSMAHTLPLTHYLLCIYEADGFDRKEIWTTPGRGNNTVEHILPQTVKPNTEWGKYWIGQFKNLDNCDTYKNWLGNYAFLTKEAQSKALNKPFDAKKIVYRDDTDMKLTQELVQCENWTLKEIKKRQARMAEVWVKSISFSV